MGALISERRLAIRVMAGAAMCIAILLVGIVSTASAAHACSLGFCGPSVRTETAQKDPMFHTEHIHDFFCANNVTDPTSYDLLVAGSTSCKRTTDHSSRWMPQLKIQRHSPDADSFGFLLPVFAALHRRPVRQRQAVPQGLQDGRE